MFLKFITLTSAAILIAGAGFAVSIDAPVDAESPNKSKHAHDHPVGYVKPGAAVALTHDYDGQSRLGEFETITLTLTHMYDDGYLSVDILPTEGLQIFSNLPVGKTQLQTGSALSLPVQFSGTANGIYSIAVETVYESLTGQQSRRVQSVPITIGPKPSGKIQPAAPKVSKSTPKGFIALPANEVIK